MLDILYLSHNRKAFTEASLAALRANTNWKLVRSLWLYDVGSTDGTRGVVSRFALNFRFDPMRVEFRDAGGPVDVMNDYLAQRDAGPLFAKIDSDVIVPPNWLDQCMGTMAAHPDLDLLGLEPPMSRTPNPASAGIRGPFPELEAPSGSGYAPCDAIGGVGVMRKRAFAGLEAMRPYAIYGGFTDWQLVHPGVVKGWIAPPLRLFLLDRLPIEPWASLSREYIAKGWQRPWTNYSPADSALWSWWL